MDNEISKMVLKVSNNAGEPLETKEVEELVKKSMKGVMGSKLFYRLTMLRAEGLIRRKFVGSGKGVWFWWKKDASKK